MTENYSHALTYGEKYSWKVLPVHFVVEKQCSCDKPNCEAIGKHPGYSGWTDNATNDPLKIKNYWARTNWNIGILCGEASGFFVLDVDVNIAKGKDGRETLANLEKKHGALPKTVQALTGGGGVHYLFKWPGYKISPKVGIGNGLDIRGDGSMIVVAPSNHSSGKNYAWDVDNHPDEIEIAEAPQWLLEFIKGASAGTAKVKPVAPGQKIEEGGRNAYIASMAGRMRRSGFDFDAILAACLTVNKTDFEESLSAEEIKSTVTSICRYEKGPGPATTGNRPLPREEKKPTENTQANSERATEGNGDDAASGAGDKENRLVFLGHSGGDYYYTSSSNSQIRKIAVGSHSDLTLMDIMPKAYWQEHYPRLSERGLVIGANWKNAAYDCMEKNRKIGIFDAGRIRGTGCWIDNGLVCHLGNKIWTTNGNKELFDLKSKFIYPLSQTILEPSSSLTKFEGQKLVDAINCCNWKKKESAMMVAGWLYICRLGAALPWRPHLYITGARGSGKSSFFKSLVIKALGDMAFYCASATSEAGIRQSLGANCLPVVFDEFDKNSKYSTEEMQKVISLARQSASSFDAKVIKGTSSQKALEYSVRSSFVFGSVRVPLIHDTDKSRFAVVELLKEGNTPEQYQKFLNAVELIGNDFSSKALSRSLLLFKEFEKSYEILQAELGNKYDQRFGQLYGSLLAGYWMLTNDECITKSKASELVSHIDFSEESESINDSDHDAIYNYLFYKKITHDTDNGKKDTNILQLAITQDNAALHILGCKTKHKRDEKNNQILVLQVPEKHPEIDAHFRGTFWENSWSRSLRRMSLVTRSTMKVGGEPRNCLDIVVPCDKNDDAVAHEGFTAPF